MRSVGAALAVVATVSLAGCGAEPDTAVRAVQTCGKGHVASVDNDHNSFRCRP